MSKLSFEVTEQGRQLVLKQDIEPFMEWVRTNLPYLDHEEVEKSFRMVFTVGDVGRALKLYKAMVDGYDPAAPVKALAGCTFTLLWKTAILVGAIGGCVYLYHVLTGQ